MCSVKISLPCLFYSRTFYFNLYISVCFVSSVFQKKQYILFLYSSYLTFNNTTKFLKFFKTKKKKKKKRNTSFFRHNGIKNPSLFFLHQCFRNSAVWSRYFIFFCLHLVHLHITAVPVKPLLWSSLTRLSSIVIVIVFLPEMSKIIFPQMKPREKSVTYKVIKKATQHKQTSYVL